MTEEENKDLLKQEAKDKINDIQPEVKPFWKLHIIPLALSFFLIVSVAWGYFGNKRTVSKYEKAIANMEEMHEANLKDVRAEHIKDLSNTLALAIRSEMINENFKQIDQYFTQTVKMFNIERILLVEPKTGEVILSTNKKDEGSIFENEALITASESIRKTYDNHSFAATPIMGLNSQLGVLILQID